MQASNDQLTASIFQLHIENFTKILNLMATLFFVFFGASIVFDMISFFDKDSQDLEYESAIRMIIKQLINMLGVITAIFCIIAVGLQSRGSSLKFTKMITVFSWLYVIYVAIFSFLWVEKNTDQMENDYGLSKVDLIYYIVCLLLVLMLFLKFFISKSRQYHSIVTQAILENTKQVLKNASVDGPLRFDNLN
ncbi:hypothetical protein SteCoe_25660 [Stentor coeruleus]|uniref:Transmembrane protein n=1 Tax=Stentor coeruleus TaxID=5963 RepID=A0A1R2BES6_9CILI|nr:hypothetical protein SteCoe_25660 [Stentor coeruleus]